MMNFYATGFKINFNKRLFCIEFTFSRPDGEEESIFIVINPEGAKALKEAVAEQFEEYQRRFGEVESWNVESCGERSCRNDYYI